MFMLDSHVTTLLAMTGDAHHAIVEVYPLAQSFVYCYSEIYQEGKIMNGFSVFIIFLLVASPVIILFYKAFGLQRVYLVVGIQTAILLFSAYAFTGHEKFLVVYMFILFALINLTAIVFKLLGMVYGIAMLLMGIILPAINATLAFVYYALLFILLMVVQVSKDKKQNEEREYELE